MASTKSRCARQREHGGADREHQDDRQRQPLGAPRHQPRRRARPRPQRVARPPRSPPPCRRRARAATAEGSAPRAPATAPSGSISPSTCSPSAARGGRTASPSASATTSRGSSRSTSRHLQDAARHRHALARVAAQRRLQERRRRDLGVAQHDAAPAEHPRHAARQVGGEQPHHDPAPGVQLGHQQRRVEVREVVGPQQADRRRGPRRPPPATPRAPSSPRRRAARHPARPTPPPKRTRTRLAPRRRRAPRGRAAERRRRLRATPARKRMERARRRRGPVSLGASWWQAQNACVCLHSGQNRLARVSNAAHRSAKRQRAEPRQTAVKLPSRARRSPTE